MSTSILYILMILKLEQLDQKREAMRISIKSTIKNIYDNSSIETKP